MKTTDCERARQLIPLHFAGDAETRRSRSVAAHLEACAPCRSLAADFAASREMLREACEPPQFDADFYEQIRSGVLSRIARDDRPAPTRRAAPFAALFDLLSGRRLAFAASLALVATACGLGYFYWSRAPRGVERQLARDVQRTTGDAANRKQDATPTPSVTPDEDERRAAGETERRAPKRNDAPRTGGPRLKNESAGGSFRRTPSLPRLASPGPARAPEQSQTAAVQTPKRVAPQGVLPPDAPASEVARIEIQTADPNIRIIWLAPREVEGAQPKR